MMIGVNRQRIEQAFVASHWSGTMLGCRSEVLAHLGRLNGRT